MALNLFNYGYYWETHQAFEDLWHVSGRKGTTALFLQTLIHLAAAGVKARNDQVTAMQNHGKRALDLLHEILLHLPKDQERFMGLLLSDLQHVAEGIAVNSIPYNTVASNSIAPLFPFFLEPDEQEIL